MKMFGKGMGNLNNPDWTLIADQAFDNRQHSTFFRPMNQPGALCTGVQPSFFSSTRPLRDALDQVAGCVLGQGLVCCASARPFAVSVACASHATADG